MKQRPSSTDVRSVDQEFSFGLQSPMFNHPI